MSAARVDGSSEAGPIVATILVRRDMYPRYWLEAAMPCRGCPPGQERGTATVGQGPHLVEEVGVVRSTRVPAGSGAGYLDPGKILVRAGFTGQTQHTFAEDVAENLRGAALDRVGPRSQEVGGQVVAEQ